MGALGNVTGFWEGLTGPSRRLLIGAVVIFIVGIFLLMRFSGSDSYVTLATSTSAADASPITKQLDSLAIRYQLTDGGSTVQVPAADVDQARIDLAGSGVLEGGAVVGNEIFDKSNLGATDFTNRVNLVRAREGELSRAIGRLDPIQPRHLNRGTVGQHHYRSRCHGCHGVMPLLADLGTRYQSKPFAILGINTDDEATARTALATNPVPWRCWLDGSTSGPITSE